MDITTGQLDIPFYQLFEGANNLETPRQFIRNSEKEFCMSPVDIDRMDVEELNEYIEFLDYLWTK